jgi:hypothetical protein
MRETSGTVSDSVGALRTANTEYLSGIESLKAAAETIRARIAGISESFGRILKDAGAIRLLGEGN